MRTSTFRCLPILLGLLALGPNLSRVARAETGPLVDALDAAAPAAETVDERNLPSGVPLNSVAIVRVRSPKKTLGKGIADRKTGERMQLACIGAPVAAGSLERKCDVLRFLYADAGGEEFLVGPSFTLHDEKETRESMNRQMKDAFAFWDISKKVDQKKSFMVSRMIYGMFGSGRNQPNPSTNTRKALQVGIIMAQGFGIKLLMAGAATQGVAIAGFFAGSLLAPLILDLAILPVTAIIDGKSASKTWGFSGHDLSTLQNRASPAWSLKPKKTRSKRFQVLLRSLIRVNNVQGADGEIFSDVVFRKHSQWSRGSGRVDGAPLSNAMTAPMEDLLSQARDEATSLLNENQE